ncbi:site-specific integrase [Bacteroides sp. 519]|uniref:site-specific integrase n=1 Tax=Bacteroides sp. 519 TaxID=2302937 RepID=UPI0013D4FE4B|nr:site-specific integrase [Bacteroides sp. 519]NDV58340.1 hypothetical protein [Bacteroides sp. 519]
MNLSDFVTKIADEYKREGRCRTAETYLSTLRSMLSFHGDSLDLSSCFTRDWLYSYQEYLVTSGLSRNSIVFYISRIRSMYNKAVKQGLVELQGGLFEHLFTKAIPTMKRAVSSNTISQINEADLSGYPSLEFARDMFMLSFYLQGISFIDLAHLRKTDIYNNVIVYQRRKTSSTVNIAVEPMAWEIIRKYESQTAGSPYLLPIVSGIISADMQRVYTNALRTHNRRLKKIALLLGIKEKLTSYVSRHSWATIAYHEGVPTAVISEAMGHQSEEVTHIYLKSFDQSALSKANKMVISAILKVSEKNQLQRNRLKKTHRLDEHERLRGG